MDLRDKELIEIKRFKDDFLIIFNSKNRLEIIVITELQFKLIIKELKQIGFVYEK